MESTQNKRSSIRGKGFSESKTSFAFFKCTGIILVFVDCGLVGMLACLCSGLGRSELPARPSHSYSPRICCLTQIQLSGTGKRRGNISHPSGRTINKGESRCASSWLLLGPTGSRCPCARVRAATEADSGQLRRILISHTQIPQGGCPPPLLAGEGGGSGSPCCPLWAANMAPVRQGVTSLWLQAAGL